MLGYVMVCDEIWTKRLHTRESSKHFKVKWLETNFYHESAMWTFILFLKVFETELNSCCILCYSMLWYGMTRVESQESLRLHAMVCDFNAMAWVSSDVLWHFNAKLCYGVCC